jgi:uncharacterized lipoprotein YehR (DUF1307 family)
MKLNRNITLIAIAASLALLLSACGGPSSINGEYHVDGQKEKIGFVFNGAGKVSMNLFGQDVSTVYTVDGNKIYFHIPGGENNTLTINPDGSLSDQILGNFKKN